MYVPGEQRQEAAGENLSFMGDKDKSFSVINWQQARKHLLRSGNKWLGLFFSRLEPLLDHVPAVMLCLGGLDAERHIFREAVQLPEDLFKFFAGGQIVGLAASRGDQEEDAPQHDAEVLQQCRHTV